MEEGIFGQNLWNMKNIDAPPTSTYLVSTPIDTSHLQDAFREAVTFFKNQKQLQIEAAFLSTSVFRMKQKFRSDKGFKCMEKLNKTLGNYFELNILSIIENFYELLPKNARAGNYLPTRNMLDFILVKIQGLVRLLARIVETAKIGAHQMEERISIGQLWRLSFVMYSMMSRICFVSEKIMDFSCQFYQKILPMRASIGNVNSGWLSDSYVFPGDLKHWLKPELSEDHQLVQEAYKSTIVEVTEDSNDVEIITPIKSAFEKLLEGEENFILSEDEPEEMASDKPISPLQNTQNKKTRRKRRGKTTNVDLPAKSVVESIQTCSDLKKFLSKESEVRENDRKNSIFGHLDALQWNMVQNCVKKFLRKAVKLSSDQDKVDQFLHKTREVLKANLND